MHFKFTNKLFCFAVFIFAAVFVIGGCRSGVDTMSAKPVEATEGVSVVAAATENDFLDAVVKGDYDTVVASLDKHPAWIDSRVHKWGSPPLCIAAWEQHPRLVRFFLDRGADVHGCHEKWRWMAIHEASERGNVEIMQMLIAAGADINAQIHSGMTPLMLTIGSEKPAAAKLLIEAGADTSYVDDEGWTLLHIAACIGDIDLAKIVMSKGQDVNAASKTGQSPLFWAAGSEMVRYLIDSGADVSVIDNSGRSPLHIAAMLGRTGASEAMIAGGVDIKKLDSSGQSAADVANAELCTKLAELLKSKGCPAGKVVQRPVRISHDRKGTLYQDGKAIFPFGVWQQPKRLFEYNKFLGINWLIFQNGVGDETVESAQNYIAAAREKGMCCVMQHQSGLEVNDNVVGWGGGYGGYQGLRQYESFRKLSPQVLICSNIGAHAFLEGKDVEHYKEFFARIDCLIPHVWPEMFEDRPRDIRMVGKLVDMVRECCKDLPRGEIAIMPDINCHHWHGPDFRQYDPPTVEEFRFQIWLAVIHGADGIVLFPISFHPFVFNQIGGTMAETMPQLVAEVQQFAEVLAADESEMAFKLSAGAPDAILDVTTRHFDGDDYIFVLNGTSEPTEITFQTGGLGLKVSMHDMLKDKAVEIKGTIHAEKLAGLDLRVWKILRGE